MDTHRNAVRYFDYPLLNLVATQDDRWTYQKVLDSFPRLENLRSAAGRVIIERDRPVRINLFRQVYNFRSKSLDYLNIPSRRTIPPGWLPYFLVQFNAEDGERVFVPHPKHESGLPLLWRLRIYSLTAQCYLTYLSDVLIRRRNLGYSPIPILSIKWLDFSIDKLNSVIQACNGSLRKLSLAVSTTSAPRAILESQVVLPHLIRDLDWSAVKDLEELYIEAACPTFELVNFTQHTTLQPDQALRMRPRLPHLHSLSLYLYALMDDFVDDFISCFIPFDSEGFEKAMPSAGEVAIFMLSIGGFNCTYDIYVKARLLDRHSGDWNIHSQADTIARGFKDRIKNEMLVLEKMFSSTAGCLKFMV